MRLSQRLASVAVAATLPLAGAARAESATAVRHAPLILGDSLTVQATPLIHRINAVITVRAVPGTAPCDWQPRLAGLWAAAGQPRVVELAFIGSHFTPCAQRPTDAAVIANYRTSIDAMATWLAPRGVTLVLSAPPSVSDPQAFQLPVALRGVYQDIARRHRNARYREDAALAVCPDLAYAATLNGVRIRSADGTHFTPAGASLYAHGLVAATTQSPAPTG
jgi:hypothetical protein